MRAQLDASNKNMRTLPEGKQPFNQMVQSHAGKLQQAELQKLMSDITVQGDRLARFRSFRDLAKFKRLVRSFLKEAVTNGLHLEESHSFQLSGQSQKLITVKQVDEKLVELTETVLSDERKMVDLLGLIGEIKGLLINLYT